MQLWKMMYVGELYTEAIIPTLFSYLLQFCYPYILLNLYVWQLSGLVLSQVSSYHVRTMRVMKNLKMNGTLP